MDFISPEDFIPQRVKAVLGEIFGVLPRTGQYAVVFLLGLGAFAIGYAFLAGLFSVLRAELAVILYGLLAVLSTALLTPRILGPPKELLPWQPGLFLDRQRLSVGAAEALRSSPHRFIVLTGESGAGKSTLGAEFLVPALRKAGWRVVVVAVTENEATFKGEVKAAVEEAGAPVNAEFYVTPHLPSAPNQQNRLLVIDQFESLLNCSFPSGLEDGRFETPVDGVVAWFDRFLVDWLRAPNQYCVLIVRRERFLDLQFLDRRGLELFSNTVVVPAVPFAEKNANDTVEAISRLTAAAGDPQTVELIVAELRERPSVLALEIAMIVHVLDEARRRTGASAISPRTYGTLFGSRAGLLRRFFGCVIDASGDPRTASAVLFALGCQRRASAFSAGDLQTITHCGPRALNVVLRLFMNVGVVAQDTGGQYRLKHDYLAESFDDVSAGFLDAEDRDTIQYFAETSKVARDRLAAESRVSYQEGAGTRYRLLDIVFGVLTAMIVLRLWGFWGDEVERYLGLGSHDASVPGRFEVRYLPAFVGSAGCGWYCWQLFRNLFFRMHERLGLTRVAVSVTTAMILAGTVVPHLWLCFACVAGFVIGVRLGATYWGLTGRVSLYGTNLLQRTTRRLFVYLMLSLVVGLCLALVRYPALAARFGGESLRETMSRFYKAFGVWLEGALAIGMAVYMWLSWRLHAREAQSAVMLGIWDRMKSIEVGAR